MITRRSLLQSLLAGVAAATAAPLIDALVEDAPTTPPDESARRHEEFYRLLEGRGQLTPCIVGTDVREILPGHASTFEVIAYEAWLPYALPIWQAQPYAFIEATRLTIAGIPIPISDVGPLHGHPSDLVLLPWYHPLHRTIVLPGQALRIDLVNRGSNPATVALAWHVQVAREFRPIPLAAFAFPEFPRRSRT